MGFNLAINYFSKLINSEIDQDTIIKLSSGQAARAHAWLKKNNLNVDVLSLGNGFTVAQLMGFTKSSSPTPQSMQENFFTNSDMQHSIDTPIGIDIQSISEFFPLGISSDPKADPELLGIFTMKELSYAQSRPNPMQTLTGLFSAKEAILKCSKKNIAFIDLEILPDQMGRPIVEGYSVSISHSQEYAVAIAIQNFKLNTSCEIKVQDSKSFPSNHSSVLDESFIGKRIIDYLIPVILLGLLAIELLRFLA